MNSTRRFATLVMGIGIVVLVGTIAIGERIGDRSLGTPLDDAQNLVPVIAITPAPNASAKPFGPDWDSSYALSSAPDPGFPDPRVPPHPLPTPLPVPTPGHVAPLPVRPTYNPNIPVWRQTPLPGTTPASTLKPTAQPSQTVTAQPSGAASPEPSPSASPSRTASPPS